MLLHVTAFRKSATSVTIGGLELLAGPTLSEEDEEAAEAAAAMLRGLLSPCQNDLHVCQMIQFVD